MSRGALGLALAAALALAGCTEERIVSVRGGLTGLPGAEGGRKADAPLDPARAGQTQWEPLLAEFNGSAEPDEAPDPQTLRATLPDGSVRLVSRSPNDVMFHLARTLANDERPLLLDQVMSDALKRSYASRDLDPAQGADYLFKHRQDIARLLAAIPLGEQTPGVYLEPIGRNAFRLRAPAQLAPDLRFTSIDFIIERGQFRLLLVGRE